MEGPSGGPSEETHTGESGAEATFSSPTSPAEKDALRESEYDRGRGFAMPAEALAGDIPPFETWDEEPAPGEAALPPARIGEEAARAEAAFRMESDWARSSADQEASAEIEIHLEEDDAPARRVAPDPAGLDAPGRRPEERRDRAPRPYSGADPAPSVDARHEPAADPATFEDRRPLIPAADMAASPDARHEPAAEPAIFEDRRPLIPAADTRASADARHEPAAGKSRVALLLGATPYRLRRRLLDAMGQAVASENRGVLLVESPSFAREAEEPETEEDPLTSGSPLLRRELGAAPRDLLLLSNAERTFIFAGLASDEKRSALIVMDIELPESILSPRLQFLVDTIVVALTSQETSLYEAYRALRGLADRRPDLAPHFVVFARSADEAERIAERFRKIAREFLAITVLDGGWLAVSPGEAPGENPEFGLSASLVETLRSAPRRGKEQKNFLGEEDRTFFEQLGDWFARTGRG